MKKNFITSFMLLALAPGLTGCATIIDGSSQKVGFSSNPSNAVVIVDGKTLGHTPLTEDLSKKDTHSVKINLDGYYPYEMILTKQTNSWVWGNLVFGGLIGLGVDAITGGMYELTPKQVNADMKKHGMASNKTADNALYVAVTFQADPSWKKIGDLHIK